MLTRAGTHRFVAFHIPTRNATRCTAGVIYGLKRRLRTRAEFAQAFELLVSFFDLADYYITARDCAQGDCSVLALAGMVSPIASGNSFKYLRHIDNAAFEKLLSLGARNGDEVLGILNKAGADTVIRAMTDKAGNQIVLRAGNRELGLRHIVGRHLTGEIHDKYTTYFSDRLKVGDVVDLVTQTVQNGDRTWSEFHKNWHYRWYHETWGWINVLVNEAGELTYAFPD